MLNDLYSDLMNKTAERVGDDVDAIFAEWGITWAGFLRGAQVQDSQKVPDARSPRNAAADAAASVVINLLDRKRGPKR